jgi:hypothetical protein
MKALTSLAEFATQDRVADATEACPCSFAVRGPPNTGQTPNLSSSHCSAMAGHHKRCPDVPARAAVAFVESGQEGLAVSRLVVRIKKLLQGHVF